MIDKNVYLVNLGIFVIFLVAMILARDFSPAAAAYPLLICRVGIGLTVILTIKLLIRDIILKKHAEKEREAREDLKKKRLTKEHYKNILIFMGMLFIYIFSIIRLGYFVSTITYLLVAMSVFNKKINWKIIVVSVLFSILMYLIFDRFLHIMIPHGILY